MGKIKRWEAVKINIQKKVESACELAGITVEKLGLKMGMSLQAINKRLETGKLSQEELERMASIMGCEYHSFFQFEDGSKVE